MGRSSKHKTHHEQEHRGVQQRLLAPIYPQFSGTPHLQSHTTQLSCIHGNYPRLCLLCLPAKSLMLGSGLDLASRSGPWGLSTCTRLYGQEPAVTFSISQQGFCLGFLVQHTFSNPSPLKFHCYLEPTSSQSALSRRDNRTTPRYM